MVIYGIIKRNGSDTMARPPKYVIELDDSDIKKLQALVKKTSKSIIRRYQILLELDTNNLNHMTQQ